MKCWGAALSLPDGSNSETKSPPPFSELNRDSLAGATSIVPFEGVLESLQISPEDAALANMEAPGKPLSTLNAELLLSGQNIVPFNATMQLRTMHVLSGLLQEFPHIAELKTVGVRHPNFADLGGLRRIFCPSLLVICVCSAILLMAK